MTERLPTTKRQEWDEYAESTQMQVNETLAELESRVMVVNMRLAELHETDPETIPAVADNMVNRLNKAWGHVGDQFMVSGSCWMPSAFNENGDAISYARRNDLLDIFPSDGFDFRYVPGEDGRWLPKIGMSFGYGLTNAEKSLHKENRAIDTFVFADLNEISLYYLRPESDRVVTAKTHQVFDALQTVHDLLRSDAQGTMSGHESEEIFVQTALDMAQEALPPLFSYDKFMLHKIEIQKFYVREETGRVKMYGSEEPYKVWGQVVGVTTRDTLMAGDGRVQNGQTADTGLYLVIKPMQASFDLEFLDGTDVIVPFDRRFNLHAIVQ